MFFFFVFFFGKPLVAQGDFIDARWYVARADLCCYSDAYWRTWGTSLSLSLLIEISAVCFHYK